MGLIASSIAQARLAGEMQDKDFFPGLGESIDDVPPSQMEDMHTAVRIFSKAYKAIVEAQKQGDPIPKITVYGDFDTDGITATAIMVDWLRDTIGAENVLYYCPTRKEGHGPNYRALDALIKEGAGTFIFVDCAIGSHEEIAYLNKKDHDVIILDHHEVDEEMGVPQVRISSKIKAEVAAVDPARPDDLSGLHGISGAAVAYQFIRKVQQWEEYQKDYKWIDDHLVLPPQKMGAEELRQRYKPSVTLSTVADVMPLNRYNRSFVAQGLALLQMMREGSLENALPGLNYFIQLAMPRYQQINARNKSIDPEIKLRNKEAQYLNPDAVVAKNIGFDLGPLLNSANRMHHLMTQNELDLIPESQGRVGEPNLALEMLLSQDADAVRSLFSILQQWNSQRKKTVEEWMQNVGEQTTISEQDNVIWYIDETGTMPGGIAGLLAGKLSDTYGRPAVVGAIRSGRASASARAPWGADIGHALRVAMQENNIAGRTGGHAGAAGFNSVPPEELDTFRSAVNRQLKSYRTPAFRVDGILPADRLQDIGQLAEQLSLMEPFGEGNRAPIFLIANAQFIYPEPKEEVGQVDAEKPKRPHQFYTVGDGEGHEASAVIWNVADKPQLRDMLNLIYAEARNREELHSQPLQMLAELEKYFDKGEAKYRLLPIDILPVPLQPNMNGPDRWVTDVAVEQQWNVVDAEYSSNIARVANKWQELWDQTPRSEPSAA